MSFETEWVNTIAVRPRGEFPVSDLPLQHQEAIDKVVTAVIEQHELPWVSIGGNGGYTGLETRMAGLVQKTQGACDRQEGCGLTGTIEGLTPAETNKMKVIYRCGEICVTTTREANALTRRCEQVMTDSVGFLGEAASSIVTDVTTEKDRIQSAQFIMSHAEQEIANRLSF